MHFAKRHRILTRSIALLLTASGSSFAEDNFWTGTVSNNWNEPANWSLNRVPVKTSDTVFDDAIVNTLNNFPVITADIVPGPRDVVVARGANTVGRIDQNAGSFSSGGGNWTFVGTNGGTGTFNLTGPNNTLGTGTYTSGGRLYIGGQRDSNGGGTGTFRINTTGSVTAGGDFSVGTRGGTGTVNMSAGTLNANTWFIIGETQGGVGGSTGTFVQDGGNVKAGATDANGRLWIGSQEGDAGPASNGSYTINGGTFTTPNAIIGRNYTGTFNQNGGTVTFDTGGGGDHRLGEAAGSTGNYNLTNGTLNLNNNFQIGASGTGSFVQTGGTVNANNFPVVGRFGGGVGTLSVSAGTFNQLGAANALIIGEEGTGTLNVSATGVVNTANNLTLGLAAAGNGSVFQTGGTVNVGGILDVQAAGTGSYALSGGTLSVGGTIDATSGTFTFTGGTLTRPGAGVINFDGSLTTGSNAATLGLDAGKTFNVTGTFNKTAGITLELTGRAIPAYDGSGIDTGSFTLGTTTLIVGAFDPAVDKILGLGNPSNAVFISEAQGEGGLFNPNTQSVFWVQESGGQVTLNYSLVPEPGTVGLLTCAGIVLSLRRRRRK